MKLIMDVWCPHKTITSIMTCNIIYMLVGYLLMTFPPVSCSPTSQSCWTKALWRCWCSPAATVRVASPDDPSTERWTMGRSTRCASRGWLAGRCLYILLVWCHLKFRRFNLWFPAQVLCGAGWRGGEEGGDSAQWPARQPAAALPRWDSSRGGADVQQSQRPVPRMHMEPDDQRCVCTNIQTQSFRISPGFIIYNNNSFKQVYKV